MKLRHVMQERRVMLWNRILQGNPPSEEELNHELLSYSRDADEDERLAVALLYACSRIARGDSEAMKRNLLVSMLCWFSAGPRAEEKLLPQPLGGEPPRINEITGLNLSWREASMLVGSNSNDYSARKRLLECLQSTCVEVWRGLYGGSSSGPFGVGLSHA